MGLSDRDVTYSQFACIGAGFSGIGLGATLKRWYGITDLRIFERESQLGGTWHINQYPGELTNSIQNSISAQDKVLRRRD